MINSHCLHWMIVRQDGQKYGKGENSVNRVYKLERGKQREQGIQIGMVKGQEYVCGGV